MNIPQKGFYYHYKHNSQTDINNYAYEVIGVGLHTEGSHGEVDSKDVLVVYRPLYEAFVYENGKMFDIRPLEMFMEDVTKEGKTFPRFQKITNSEIISKLEKIKISMYGSR